MTDEWRNRAHRDGSHSSDDGARHSERSKPTYVDMLMAIFGEEEARADFDGINDKDWSEKTFERYRDTPELRNPRTGRGPRLDYFRRRCGTCRDEGIVQWQLLPNAQQNPAYLRGDPDAKPLYREREGGNLNFRNNGGPPGPTPVTTGTTPMPPNLQAKLNAQLKRKS